METHETDEKGGLRSAQPYLNWAIGTEGVFLRSGNWFPLLVEFTKDMALGEFRRVLASESGSSSLFRIPEVFGTDGPLPDEFSFCVVLVEEKAFKKGITTSKRWSKFILHSDMGPPVTLPEVDAASDYAPSASSGSAAEHRVVVAVIDQGIAFAHPRFRYRHHAPSGDEDRTRVEFVWVQDASGAIAPGTPGKEITANQIDNAVHHADTHGKNDESIYRALGVLEIGTDGYKPLARRQAHGTHVLDMASGYEIKNAPSTRPIIAVEMPEAAVGDPAGSTLKPHAAWGLVYILWRTLSLQRLGETLPVVVNISYGPQEGPHDGSSAFERFVDALTQFSRWLDTPMRVVLAAGNYRQSRAHASFRLDKKKSSQVLDWRLQPCGMTSSFMEIYFPSGHAVTVKLKPPHAPALVIATSMPPNVAVEPPGATTPAPYTLEYVETGAALSSIVLCVAPTAQDYWAPGPHPIVPSGVWRVIVSIATTGTEIVPFDAWIKRTDTPGGRRAKGRQSYFDDGEYQRYDTRGRPVEFDAPGTASYVRRRNTLSGIATGCETYVIGAYQRGPDSTDQVPTFYSSEASGNPTPGRMSLAVNWLAPAEDAASCPGALGAGTRNGTRVAMNGTSVASPQAVRYCADVWSTGVEPSPIPPSSELDPPSSRVPGSDQLLVAGVGLMRLKPPIGHVWLDRP